MPKLSREDRIIRAIIKEHGQQLDLQANPGLFIELVRKYALDLSGFADGPDGGLPPGGVGPVGPTSRQLGPNVDDLMKEVMKVQRQLAVLSKKLAG